ncbi:MAG: thymidylate kinase [Oscillospiraceae bacterium]|jgi:dTMP kinase|nr:thymidylate kinase [Oscillospiraceae bacterium]
MGKLIVLEGVDGSGKTTQMRRLTARLAAEGADFRRVAFPRYESPASAPLRMYLGGELGGDPDGVNAYAASTLFAVDRYVSYLREWGGDYARGGLILTDRYTTSNAVHQAAKLEVYARAAFWAWLYDFEFAKMGLPKPDLVLCLDLPAELSLARRKARAEQSGAAPDIHERDADYLRRCAETARAAAEFYGWRLIDAARDEDAVGDALYRAVRETLA